MLTRWCPTPLQERRRGRPDDQRAGRTTIGELYLLYGIAHKKLEAQGIKVFRSYVNEYCTSLEMAGASLTMLKVNEEIKGLLNEPAEVSIRVF